MNSATETNHAASPNLLIRRVEPEPLRSVPVTPAGVREILWQFPYAINRRDTPESSADLRSWVYRNPRLDWLDLDNEIHVRQAEQIRIDSIVAELTLGRSGWLSGGEILTSRSAWPQGFRSRVLRARARTRAEIAWVADVAGLRALWLRRTGGWSVILALPGIRIPQFDGFIEIVREARIDPSTVAGLT